MLARVVQMCQRRMGQLAGALSAAGVPPSFLNVSDPARPSNGTAAAGATGAEGELSPDITPSSSNASLPGPPPDPIDLLEVIQRERPQFQSQAQVRAHTDLGCSWPSVLTAGAPVAPRARSPTWTCSPSSHKCRRRPWPSAPTGATTFCVRVCAHGVHDGHRAHRAWSGLLTHHPPLAPALVLVVCLRRFHFFASAALVQTLVATLPANRDSMDDVRGAVTVRLRGVLLTQARLDCPRLGLDPERVRRCRRGALAPPHRHLVHVWRPRRPSVRPPWRVQEPAVRPSVWRPRSDTAWLTALALGVLRSRRLFGLRRLMPSLGTQYVDLQRSGGGRVEVDPNVRLALCARRPATKPRRRPRQSVRRA